MVKGMDPFDIRGRKAMQDAEDIVKMQRQAQAEAIEQQRVEMQHRREKMTYEAQLMEVNLRTAESTLRQALLAEQAAELVLETRRHELEAVRELVLETRRHELEAVRARTPAQS